MHKFEPTPERNSGGEQMTAAADEQRAAPCTLMQQQMTNHCDVSKHDMFIGSTWEKMNAPVAVALS